MNMSGGCPILFAHFAKRVGDGNHRDKGGPARQIRSMSERCGG